MNDLEIPIFDCFAAKLTARSGAEHRVVIYGPDDEWLTSNLTLDTLRGAVVPSQQ
jgi:hypothetical protein